MIRVLIDNTPLRDTSAILICSKGDMMILRYRTKNKTQILSWQEYNGDEIDLFNPHFGSL